MTGKERINRIINRQDVDRCGFWMGNPHPEALKIYNKYFEVKSFKELILKLNNDMVWFSANRYLLGAPLIMPRGLKAKKTLSEGGLLQNAECIEDVDKIHWRKAKYLSFGLINRDLKFAIENNLAILSGMQAGFWHDLTDFFGMEECLIKMYTHPEIVLHAVNRITEVYYNANEVFFKKYAHKIDAFFFFNDLGTQLDTLISPEHFREFVLPSMIKLTEQAKRYNLKVALHSCGSIDKFIPDIIKIGVDILHPIQAKAKNMEAEKLQDKYGKDIVFLGGVDTQELLPFKKPEEVRAEVKRLKGIFGKHYIVSPSHEALLSNVPPKNLLAMKNEAVKV